MGADPNDPFVYDEPPYNVYLELRPLAPDGSFLPDSDDEKSDKGASGGKGAADDGEGAVGGEGAASGDDASDDDSNSSVSRATYLLSDITSPDLSPVPYNSSADEDDDDDPLPVEYRPRRNAVEDRYILYNLNGRYIRLIL